MYKFILTAFFVLTLCIQCAMAETEEFFGIGAELSQDAYNKKVIVVGILDNTPAQRAGINIGDEITAVEGKSTKKLSLCEVVSMIRGEENTNLKLKVKQSFFKRKTIELIREKITVDTTCNAQFDSHWLQIATPCCSCPKIFPPEAVKKFSRKHRKNIIALNEYWAKRKQTFEIGYSACLNYSNKNNQELCLMHLVDRESAKTNADKAIFKFLSK